MIRREFSADLPNRVSREAIPLGNPYHASQPLDWAPIVDRCVILSNGEDAIQVYENKAPRVWEVMTVFGPTCRGKRALETAYAMRDWMLPCVTVAFGQVPDALPQAQWFYRKIGGHPAETIETDDAVFTAAPGQTLFEFRNGTKPAVYRTRDAEFVNAFANDSTILPYCGFPEGTTQVDVLNVIDSPGMEFVTDGQDAMICFQRVEGGWEFHSMFREGCRGRKAIDAAKAMFDWMVGEHGPLTLLGTCPVHNRAVRWFCRQLGMASDGISGNAQFGPVETFRKSIPCH